MKIYQMEEKYRQFIGDESRLTGYCDSLSFPETEDEAAEILAHMAASKTPVTLQGGLTGVTGGYLWSYPLMVALCGIRPKTESTHLDTLLTILLALIGLMIVETIGGLQWVALAGDKTVAAVFTYSIVAFIPKDILLTILAVLIGRPIQKTLKKL